MKKNKQTTPWFCQPIDNRLSYSLIFIIIIAGFILISFSLKSLRLQIERLIDLQNQELKVSTENKEPSSIKNKDKMLTVKVKVDAKKQRVFDGEIDDSGKISIVEALSDIKEARGLGFNYNQDNNKTTIKEINGVEIKDGNYNLRYYINGFETSNDPAQVQVGAGDTVEITAL